MIVYIIAYYIVQVRFSKKNTPLPQLNREKKRIFNRNVGSMNSQQVNNYLQKEVRQHDNLVLKQKNNHLASENMKLKTRVMALQNQNARLTKLMEDQGTKLRQPGLLPKDNKYKSSQSLSLKMAIKNLRKQLDEQKKQNQKIKWSIKFTRISELECQRDNILSETTRLRQIIEDQQFRKLTTKQKQQGISSLQQKIHILGDKNLTLVRENTELQNKFKKFEDSSKKYKQVSENEKNLNKMLFNARRVIKQKQKQIQVLKEYAATQGKIQSVNSIGVIDIKSAKQVTERVPAFASKSKNKEKRTMSKSAQKYRKNTASEQSGGSCENCAKLKQQVGVLQKKIVDLSLALQKQRENSGNRGLGDFRRQEIKPATEQDINDISKFLTFRFKAHHLSLQQAERYLINSEINQKTLVQEVSVLDIAESLVAEPFSIISSHYLQVCLMKLFYPEQCAKGQNITISEEKKVKKQQILKGFRNIVPEFEIMPQQKQQQMFIQIAQLVTNYHQHILTALNRKKNGEGTIAQAQLCSFFSQIELQKQFVDFIICQIILESVDLEHLNYYTMFQIFYMPNQGGINNQQMGASDQPNKKKFQVDHSQVVKQQDEQYEQSRSYVEVKQKTHSRRDDDELDLDDQVPMKGDDRIMKSDDHIVKSDKHLLKKSDRHLLKSDRQKPGAINKSGNDELVEQYDQQQSSHNNSYSASSPKKQKKSSIAVAVVTTNSNNNNNNNNNNSNNNNNNNKIEDGVQQYQQYFQQQKMEQLPEQAHQQDIVQQEQMKPYMMEQVFEQYQEQPKK